MHSNPIPVSGTNGKSGRRISALIATRGQAVRRGKRQSEAPFDVEPPACWPAPVEGAAFKRHDHMSPVDLRDIRTFAHDLRGPLANLSLLLEAIESRSQQGGDSEAEALATGALRAIERMNGMISSMLARSRVGTGEPAMVRRIISLTDVVDMAGTLNQPLAARHGVRLQSFLVEPLAVMGDGDLLLRAIDNLLTNAIKFSPAGGLVVCQLGLAGGEAVFRIEDEGPGLGALQIENAFGPSMPSSSEHSGPLGSNGLGLSIVRAIAECHGGTVSVCNSPSGRGAVFEMRLPCLAQPDQLDGSNDLHFGGL